MVISSAVQAAPLVGQKSTAHAVRTTTTGRNACSETRSPGRDAAGRTGRLPSGSGAEFGHEPQDRFVPLVDEALPDLRKEPFEGVAGVGGGQPAGVVGGVEHPQVADLRAVDVDDVEDVAGGDHDGASRHGRHQQL